MLYHNNSFVHCLLTDQVSLVQTAEQQGVVVSNVVTANTSFDSFCCMCVCVCVCIEWYPAYRSHSKQKIMMIKLHTLVVPIDLVVKKPEIMIFIPIIIL